MKCINCDKDLVMQRVPLCMPCGRIVLLVVMGTVLGFFFGYLVAGGPLINGR